MIRLPWFKHAPLPPAVAAYLEATPRRLARRTPLDDVPFVVIDSETTGFDSVHDRILSLAAMPVRAGRLQISDLRSWLVYHSDVPMTDAVRIHGILPSDARAGDPEQAVLGQLLPILSGAVLIGHHIGFDVRMLNEALHRRFRIRLRNATLDTAAYAMQTVEAFRKTGYAGQRMPSLEEVCTHLGIAPLDRHTAAGDTFTTAELFLVLCARHARDLRRPLTLADLPVEAG